MARLNEGLALFDAILIVPMFQIFWTFFSICTGFVYFQEYQVEILLGSFIPFHSMAPLQLGDLTLFFPLQVFDMLRTMMFILGMGFVFVGISLLAPEDSKGMSSAADCTLICSTVFFIAYHIQSCGRNYNLANVKLRGNLAIDLSLL